jgi:hypothetical protein
MTPNVSGTATKASSTKVSQVSKAQANLPLPEIPPVPSDWISADARTVNSRVGEGASTETRQRLDKARDRAMWEAMLSTTPISFYVTRNSKILNP